MYMTQKAQKGCTAMGEYNRIFGLGAIGSALTLFVFAMAPARAAHTERVLPPGQYLIDMEASANRPQGVTSIHAHTDGANGNSTLRTRTGAIDGGEQLVHGKAPQSYCVRGSAGEALPVAPDGGALKCTRQSTSEVGDTVVHRAVCPAGNVKLSLRRLDEKRWEYVSEIEMGSTSAQPNLDALRPTIEQEAREGKTPAARAKAARMLAELPAMQAEMVDKRSAAADKLGAALRKSTDPAERAALEKTIALMQGTMPMTARTRYIWTRIADTCVAAPPK